MENLSKIIQQILGSGITVSGHLGINGLTITSTDKAKELGIFPQGGQQQNQQGQESQQGKEEGQDQSSGKSGQGEQQQEEQSGGEQISRDEFENLKEEIRYLRKLSESVQPDQGEQKSRSGQSK